MKGQSLQRSGFAVTSLLSAMALMGLGYFIYDAHQTGGGMMGQMMGGMMKGKPRHQFVMRNGLPKAYSNAENPLKANQENIDEGKRLFALNCATCHGETGKGDGPTAKSLDPAPADLVDALRKPIVGDGFLFWTISEGGAPIQSAMPAFKQVLTPQQQWQIIHFMQQMQ